jgi:LmbE family N-acetylglucosaminyl deacetylase
MTTTSALRLLCVLAHPDDESLGTGGILAKYSAEGVETYLLTATRGERGWTGEPEDNPGLEALGRIREAELHAAANMLGLHEVAFLDYIDGDVDQAEPLEAIARIASHLRRIRPQVVVTFAPDGYYGHPDHIATSQFTTAALLRAADASYTCPGNEPPHLVAKLYYTLDSQTTVELIRSYVGRFGMAVDGVERGHVGWEEWAITTRVDATAYWHTVWQAAQCHRSQMVGFYDQLSRAPESAHQQWFGQQTFYRVYSLMNGGRQIEDDLFAGLRVSKP